MEPERNEKHNAPNILLVKSVKLIDKFIDQKLLYINMYTNEVKIEYDSYQDFITYSQSIGGIIDFLKRLSLLIRTWITFERHLKRGECERMKLIPDPSIRERLYSDVNEHTAIIFNISSKTKENGTEFVLIDSGIDTPIKMHYPSGQIAGDSNEEVLLNTEQSKN